MSDQYDQKPNTTAYVYIAVDASGSMCLQKPDTTEAVRALLKQLDDTAGDQRTHLTLITFNDSVSTEYTGVLNEKSSEISALFAKNYSCKKGTAFYDALGSALQLVQPNTTVVVATDGKDNASTTFTLERVTDLIESTKKDFATKFLFLAEGSESLDCCERLGLVGEEIFHATGKKGETLSNVLQSQSFMETASQLVFSQSVLEEDEDDEEPVLKRFKTQESLVV